MRSLFKTKIGELPESISVPSEKGPLTVRLRRNNRAKKYILRVPVNGKPPILTVPKGGTLRTAKDFAARQTGWLQQKLKSGGSATRVIEGNLIPFRGVLHEIRHSGALRGGVTQQQRDGERPLLLVAGDPENIAKRLFDFMKKEAKADLEVAVTHHATTLGKQPTAISVRDTKSRWGSCASNGRLSFSWRLVMAPPEVLDYVAAHEVAHLARMDHSPEFWRICTSLAPQTPKAKKWLSENGGKLHRFN